MAGEPQPILLFDGECNLCNRWVQFVLRHERHSEIRFASLQSEVGGRLLRLHNIPDNQLDTVVFIEHSRAYVRSTAVLRVMRYLNTPYCWLASAILVPRPIRDGAYRLIARYRIRLFGYANTSCPLPNHETRSRILE